MSPIQKISIIALLFASMMPFSVHAQACTPGNPSSCARGSICKDITGGGVFYCALDGTGGTPNGTTPGGTLNGTTPGGTPNGTTPGGTPNGTTPDQSGRLENPLRNIDSLSELIDALLAAVVTIGGIVLMLALVYVGFLFVAAQGKEEEIRNARAALMWTVIGGLILLGATAIKTVIEATVGGLT